MPIDFQKYNFPIYYIDYAEKHAFANFTIRYKNKPFCMGLYRIFCYYSPKCPRWFQKAKRCKRIIEPSRKLKFNNRVKKYLVDYYKWFNHSKSFYFQPSTSNP